MRKAAMRMGEENDTDIVSGGILLDSGLIKAVGYIPCDIT